jgi:TRAP transporter TAXI family solute receptor
MIQAYGDAALLTGDRIMRRGNQLALILLASLTIVVDLGVLFVMAGQEKPWKTGDSVELVLASGGTGGTYFPLAGGVAKLWKDSIPGLNVTVQATGASVANIRLLGKGDADLALVQNDIADYGRTGRESFVDKKEKYTNYLAMAALYPEAVQVVVRSESAIRNIEDLKGKKVVVGAAASGTELAARQIFSAYGITYRERKDITPLFLGFAEGATALRDNSVDALVIVAGIPSAVLADVQTTTTIRLLSVDVNKLKANHPFYVKFTVKAGTYRGLESDVETVALKAMIVVRDEINSQLVREMTKALFEKAGAIAHAKAKEFDVKLGARRVTRHFDNGSV